MLQFLETKKNKAPQYSTRSYINPETGDKEVPVEMLNATIGSNLISFGTGG
jgi:hypothetical protein